ncbi:hypothetical protein DTW90_21965 [Neorhizobium sp. P12A]|uniref:hypothetical protein n=1 Tax=Neorhizobium sp. P12A TaxID=2268027 RepID=UPI0011EEF011|nr:hypothetical protein [Neorhizobium sp. P12A]KAA0695646.1 hypothetical protein DTW90_21965 [Neorhizobium sp. P12A]
MGTSKTSSGPGKNVPLVPSWVGSDTPPIETLPSPPLTGPDGDGGPLSSPAVPPDKKPEVAPEEQKPGPQQPMAPPRRFTAAKRAIGDFTKSGDERRLRKALGNYVRNGYGGSSTASQRMSKAASAASGVYDVLSRGQTTESDGAEAPILDLSSLAGLSHSEVAERIAEAVNPGDVSLDDAGAREAIAEAISSVLSENEDADVTNLPTELAEECYVRTLSISIFNVLVADIGASVWRAAHGNAPLANERLKEISDYVREAYRAQYVKLKARGTNINRGNSGRIGREITALVMDIFESYLE